MASHLRPALVFHKNMLKSCVSLRKKKKKSKPRCETACQHRTQFSRLGGRGGRTLIAAKYC